MNFQEKQIARYKFLQHLYDSVDGDSFKETDGSKIAEKLGLEKNDCDSIVRYLMNEGLLEPTAQGGKIAITHLGIKEIEQANSNPEEPTDHFPAINIINVWNMSNSVLQQGNVKSELLYSFSQQEVGNLKEIIQELEQLKKALNLQGELFDEFCSELDTLRSQSQSPKPKKVILHESLKTIRSIVEGVATNVLSPNFISFLSNLT